MTVAVVIPTCNRPEDLRRCLQLLAAEQPAEPRWKILVCDDSTGTSTAGMLASEFPEVRRIDGPRRGPAANRNCGVAATDTDWIVFFDDDVVPQPGCLNAYWKEIHRASDQRIALIGSTCRNNAHTGSLLWEAPHHAEDGPLPPSCNFAIARTLFASAGGFDERYVHSYEDIEFFARLRGMGADLRFVPAAAVEHPSRRLPGPARLAARWEARVLMALDFGASPFDILMGLPPHVFKVILSRFRDRHPPGELIPATATMAAEFFLVLAALPGWIRTHRKGPRSPFWNSPAGRAATPRRYGF